LSQSFWTDLYYRAMTAFWPVFFGSAALIFIALNVVFAFLYSLGHDPIANAAENGLLAPFYFSIETLATVGYGDMHPQTNYGHLVATVEIFTGMSFLAVMTGLIFARFSRPRARFVFANTAVITRHEGKLALMIRTANARHNTISRASARLWLFSRRAHQGSRPAAPLLRAQARSQRASDVRIELDAVSRHRQRKPVIRDDVIRSRRR
jgi:inward rectifier potassium channel